MKIVNSDGLDKWTYLNNKYKSSYMLKRVILEILKGSTGFEPVTVRDTSPYSVRYHFALNSGKKTGNRPKRWARQESNLPYGGG
jgi:hypothetical protein